MSIILQKENKILRQNSKEVPISQISSPKVKKIIQKMKEALLSEDDGVALAAPQIGELVQIFIISKKLPTFKEKIKPLEKQKIPVADWPDDLIFINPKIIKKSKKKEYLAEGCLSIRWLYGEVNRFSQVTIEAYNENGQKIKQGGGGLLAQIFQHEIDHLNGVLFIDQAKNLKEIPPEKITNE